MDCPHCDYEIPEGAVLCPQCGVTVEDTQPARPATTRSVGESGTTANNRLSAPRRSLFLLGLSLVAVLLLSVTLGAYLGLRAGEQEQILHREEELELHYETGLQRLEEGNYQVARAQFEYVLQLDPGHEGARRGLAEVEERSTVDPTRTVEPEEPVAEELYRKAQSHYDAGRWQEAASVLTSLRQLAPSHQSQQVEQMLFESRYRAGMDLLEDDEFELGIFYLDRAVALRPLDEEAATQRRLAKAYVEALNYWAVDWEECIARFEELYGAAPAYKDVLQRLYEAHVRYAEAWESRGEMCPAAEQYDEALRWLSSERIAQRRAEATELCRNATPTPVPTIEGARPVTQTTLPPGFNTGRLAYPVYDAGTGSWAVYSLFADGRLVQAASGADQPAWMWNRDALGYRDRVSAGLSLLPSLDAAPQRLVAGAGLAWPTFSPDGQRMAYAERDEAGSWHVVVAQIDGAGEPQRHAAGWGPAWGPTGLLAWTGCEEDDADACGIFIDNPDDDEPGRRVSASANDVGLSWSPGGNQLAYMSDHTGNWEIYIYSLDGGFQALTDDPGSDGLPAWSPDGSAIAFVSNRDGAWGIYLMRPGGEDPQQVIALGPSFPNWTQQQLSWAP